MNKGQTPKERLTHERAAIKSMLKGGYTYDQIKKVYPAYATKGITNIAAEMIEEDRQKIIKEREERKKLLNF